MIDGAGAFTGPGPQAHWVEHLAVPDLSVGTYSIPAGGTDDQEPHAEDEIYVVTSGRATFESGNDRVLVGPGTVLYVPAYEAHRFTDITQDLAALVLFAPAEGTGPAAVARRYVADFNAAVASGDYSALLRRFADDAVLTFENVPPAGRSLTFAGRDAYTAAYADQPPDDQIDLTGEPESHGGQITAGFAWRRDGSPGVLKLTLADGRISAMDVTFG